MRRETSPPALAFPGTTIVSVMVLLAGASAVARINVHILSHAVSHPASYRLQKKRLLTLRRSEMAAGARFTFISDSSLEDYSSDAEGDNFFIRIPKAIFTSMQHNPEGRGFTNMRVEQRDDVVVLSFRLQVGASVAINQSFNRLEIVFYTNERANKNSRTSKSYPKTN